MNPNFLKPSSQSQNPQQTYESKLYLLKSLTKVKTKERRARRRSHLYLLNYYLLYSLYISRLQAMKLYIVVGGLGTRLRGTRVHKLNISSSYTSACMHMNVYSHLQYIIMCIALHSVFLHILIFLTQNFALYFEFHNSKLIRQVILLNTPYLTSKKTNKYKLQGKNYINYCYINLQRLEHQELKSREDYKAKGQ